MVRLMGIGLWAVSGVAWAAPAMIAPTSSAVTLSTPPTIAQQAQAAIDAGESVGHQANALAARENIGKALQDHFSHAVRGVW